MARYHLDMNPEQLIGKPSMIVKLNDVFEREANGYTFVASIARRQGRFLEKKQLLAHALVTEGSERTIDRIQPSQRPLPQNAIRCLKDFTIENDFLRTAVSTSGR